MSIRNWRLKNRKVTSLKFTSEIWAQICRRHFVTVHLLDPYHGEYITGLFWNYANASRWLDECYDKLREKHLDAYIIIDFDGEVTTTLRINNH